MMLDDNMYEKYLFSESRMAWINNKQRKGNGKCIFCRLAKGDMDEKKILHRDKELLVMMNIFPYNTGHLQVLPLRHVKTFEELTDKEVASLFVMVKKCVRLLSKVLKPDGFNIGVNIGGDVAGASISHLHIHIVPRFRGDIGFMESVADTKVVPQTLNQIFRKLKKEAGMLKLTD